jgi:hypothetical protein
MDPSLTARLSPRPKSFSEAYISTRRFSPPGSWVLFLPHCIVMLVFVGPWSSFLIWRGRKAAGGDKPSN